MYYIIIIILVSYKNLPHPFEQKLLILFMDFGVGR